MKFFEFLARIAEEKFPVRIDYREYNGCVDVEVDAFFERWVVSFGEVDLLISLFIKILMRQIMKMLTYWNHCLIVLSELG